MSEIASLGVKIDSTDATRAAGELDKLTAAGARTEKAINRLHEVAQRTAADMSALNGRVDTLNGTQNRMLAAVERVASQMDRMAASYERSARAAGTAARAYDQVGREASGSAANVDRMNRSLTQTESSAAAAGASIRRHLLVALSGLSVMRVIDMADEWGQMASRIRMATDSTEEYERVQTRMVASANKTYRSIMETREAFVQLSPVLRQMGMSLDESMDAIDAFSGLMVTNAASSQRGADAMRALSVALQKGRLDADGWITIYSTLDSIVDTLAAHSGLAAEEIRKLGASGKLSVELIARALAGQLEPIMAQVDAMPTTVRDAFGSLSNVFSEYVGTVNETYQVTANMAKGIEFVGENLESVLTVALVATTAGLARYTGGLAAASVQTAAHSVQARIAAAEELKLAQAQMAAAQASVAQTQSMRGLTATMAQQTAAANALVAAEQRLAAAKAGVAAAGRSVLGILGGPAGIAITAGLTATAFMTMGGSARAASVDIDTLSSSLSDLTQKQLELRRVELEDQVASLEEKAIESSQALLGLHRDFDALYASAAQGANITAAELENVKRTILEQEVAHEKNSAALDKARLLLDQVVGRLRDLELAARGAAGGIDGLNRAMGFTEAGEKYLAQIQARIKALQDGGDPVKAATRWILEHASASEADKAAIMSAALAEKALIEARERASKATKAGTQALNEAKKAAEAFERTRRQYLNGLYGEISALQDQARGLEDQIALYGLAESAKYDLAIADLEAQKAALAVIDAGAEEIAILERKIELLGQMRGSQQTLERLDAEKAAWESWSRDVEQIFQQVGQSLTDALFEGGRSGRDLIKDLFKTLTLRVFVQPMLSGLQGMVTNQLGGLMGYQDPRQQGGFGGISNALSTYNNLNTLAGGVSQWMTGASVGASNLSLGYANTVGMFGGDSIGALISANGGWEQALSGLSSATSAAVTAGALSAARTVAASLSTSFGTAATTMASTSFTASLGGGAAAASGGAAAAGAGGLMTGLSAAAPWIAGGLAIASALGAFGDREPTTRREQRTQVEYADGLLDITKRDDRVQAGADAAVAQMTAAAIQSANSLFQNIGVDATIESFRSIMASSYKRDRDGVASGGTLRVGDQLIDFGITDDTNPTLGGFGGWSSVDPMQRIGTEIQLSMLEALKAVSDELPSVLSSMLEVDIRGLDEAGAADLVARFTALTEGASAFLAAIEQMPFDYLRDVSFDAAANMIQLAGGLENLVASQQTYYERFYSDAERHGHAVDQLTQALSGVGVEMPALTGSTDDMLASYRALVESLDLNTEAGQQAYVTLMQTAGAFADVAAFAGQAAVDLERAAEDQRRAAEQARQQALSDLSTAYNAVVQAGQREIARLQESFGATDNALNAYRSAVQRLESEFNSLFSAIDRGIQALRGTGAAFDAQYHQARAVISTTLLTGQLPQTADLSEAIRVAQQGVMGQRFASREDQQRAYLTLANELEAIKGIAEPELDTAKATLAQLEDQYRLLRGMSEVGEESLSALEAQLRTAFSTEEAAHRQISLIEQQIDAAREQYNLLAGIDDTLKMGFADLLAAFEEAAAVVPPAMGGGVGGGGGWDPSSYAAKNPDLADYYARNPADRGGLSFDQWLRKHYDDYGSKEGRSYAVGTSYVPYDMKADIHRGEIIIDPRSSDILRRYGIGVQGGGASRETEQLLREQLAEVRQQNRYLYEMVKSGKRNERNTEDVANAIAHGDSGGGVVVVM